MKFLFISDSSVTYGKIVKSNPPVKYKVLNAAFAVGCYRTNVSCSLVRGAFILFIDPLNRKEKDLEEKDTRVESIYMEKRIINPIKDCVDNARLKSMDEYKKLYRLSLEDPEGFWGKNLE